MAKVVMLYHGLSHYSVHECAFIVHNRRHMCCAGGLDHLMPLAFEPCPFVAISVVNYEWPTETMHVRILFYFLGAGGTDSILHAMFLFLFVGQCACGIWIR